MSSSCMGKELPKEKKWGIKNCRERKCPELRKNGNTEYPEDEQERCQVFNTMPGTLPCCIRDMDNLPPEEFLRHCIWHLHDEWEKGMHNRKTPGPKNCPAMCPYKISEQGEVFGKTGEMQWKKKPGTIWKCAFTGGVLGQGLGGSCPCHVLDNPDQDKQIEIIKQVIFQQRGLPFFRAACDDVGCPDGIIRCKAGGIICPVIKLPFIEIKECPLWRIPAKLLPAPAPICTPAQEPACTPEKPTQPKKVAEEKPASAKKRAKKEDPVCISCRDRFKEPVPDYACAACKEEQQKYGRRTFLSGLTLRTVHLGDMEELGEQIPDESIDAIFTDPIYLKDVFEDAYARLAELACRVLKPNGFLFTYAPQTHLDEIMDLVRYSNITPPSKQILHYFWVIESLNKGAQTAKNHQRNAICLHKPILVFQRAESREDLKGARRCFADVVRGIRQKKFHPWQQSIHDVLGIIDRFMVPGEILLDPYAGTGTSLIAANLLGMDWIGFEIDPKTHAIAVRELQQQPIALEAFGVEVEAAECEREPVPVQKDTSKQASIEVCKVVKAKKAEPEKLRSEACQDCESSRHCLRHDPHAGCERELLDFEKAVEEAKAAPSIEKPFVQHFCGTCGHHKGRKTFHNSCPRLGELLFKGGTKSAKVLMEETQRENCQHWIEKSTAPEEVRLQKEINRTDEFVKTLIAGQRAVHPDWKWELWKIEPDPKTGENYDWLWEIFPSKSAAAGYRKTMLRVQGKDSKRTWEIREQEVEENSGE